MCVATVVHAAVSGHPRMSASPHEVSYSESLDAASPRSVQLPRLSVSSEGDEQPLKLDGLQEPERRLKELSGLEIDELYRESDAASLDLKPDELATVLLHLGLRHNYGIPPGAAATRAQIAAFWRGLQLQDLALAHACALGREVAWQQFIARFREPLIQTAISLTGSAAMGQELADSLYAELFGLTKRGEQRRSPLAYYSGRGSLKGFLRATLAQRNVDHHRRSRRETSITDDDLPAAAPAPTPSHDVLARLRRCLAAALGSLSPEEQFLLSACFLDRRTLLEISHILRVHEATVSRRLQRLTARLHKDLVKNLRSSGMSKAAAEEALGTDPRDLDLNLRTLLQTSQGGAFLQQGDSAEREHT
jgi:RNA polymerase sigma-70 factor (ECF subfamily)